MKKRYLLSIYLFLSICVNAQDWAPVGSIWYYSDINFLVPFANFPRLISSVGDTLINGYSSRIIEGDCNCGFSGNRNFMYEESNKIYLYNSITNSFHILYDFNAIQGESWAIMTPNPADSFMVVVDSVYYRIFGNDTIQIQFVENLAPAVWEMYGEVAKGIGNITFCFFPQFSTCDPYTSDLRCYDNTENIIRFDTIPCDTTLIIGIAEGSLGSLFGRDIYPNPAEDFINIHLQFPDEGLGLKAKLYDLFGRLVYMDELMPYQSNMKLDISRLPGGLYILKVIDGNDQTVGSKKIIIK